jgi:predicted Ser/Thr protein kinase
MTTYFGKYQVLEFIGQGGFGRVFRGYDPVLKRNVAIKTCALQDADMRERFAREAEIAANLRHPNIVTVYDFGVHEGEPYIVQEYLEGEDLDDKLKRGDALELGTLVVWLRQVAEGLLFAHARGVVHRDIKPGNVRILPDGQVRIMDFGIAKLLQSEQRLTRTGLSMGTTGYLAPEQLRGIQIDHRVDIFSFGVMAYQLVARRKPFDGDSITTVLYRIAHEEPPALREVIPSCPPRLAGLIESCLRKEREDRPASFAPVISELNTVANELSGARPAGALGGATAAFHGGSGVGLFDRTATIEAEHERKQQANEQPVRRRLSPRAWGLIAATLAVAVFGVFNVSRFGRSSSADDQRTRIDSPIPLPSAQMQSTGEESTAAGDPRADTMQSPVQPADRGAASDETAATGNSAAAGAERKQVVSMKRVLLLVQSDARVAFEAAEQTLTAELLQAGYDVVDAAPGTAGGIVQAARAAGAGSVLLIDASADARPIVAGMFSGSASVNVKAYATSSGKLLASERFEIGTAQTPGEPGPTETAAASAAVKAASYSAAQLVLPLLARLQ